MTSEPRCASFAHVDADIRQLNARFDALNRTLLVVGGAILAALISGIAAMIVSGIS